MHVTKKTFLRKLQTMNANVSKFEYTDVTSIEFLKDVLQNISVYASKKNVNFEDNDSFIIVF